MGAIHTITLPRWGLSMESARVNGWLRDVGALVNAGEEILEVETEKIAGGVAVAAGGILRRQLAQVGEVVPVGGLLGVVADADVPESEIDAVVADFLASFSVKSAVEVEAGAMPEKIVVGGRTLRYLRRGQGSDVAILVHGFGGDLNNWLFNHEALAARRTIYALDLPGHGESTKDVGAGTLGELAQAVVGFLDAVGVSSAHLAGHSLGGAVALALAVGEPQRVRSLALLASAGLGAEINAGYIEGFVTATNRNALKPHVVKLFADASRVTRRMIDDLLKYKRLEGVESSLRLLSERICSGGRQAMVLREELARLRRPVLVIWGSEDQIIPARHASGLPSSVQVELIPGKGHMVMMEAAGEVNRLLNAFWS